MTPLRTSLLALSLGCALGLVAAADAADAPKPPTTTQQQELDAAREDLHRAAKRLAELSERDGGRDGMRLDLGQRALGRPVIGVLLAPEAGGGVRITGISPEGAAAGAGLKSGDRLLRINGKTIAGASAEDRLENAHDMLRELDDKTPVRLAYRREGREHEVSLVPKRHRQEVLLVDGPGDQVILHVLGDDADGQNATTNLKGLTGLPSIGGSGETQVFAFSDADSGDGRKRIERHVIRIDCTDGKDACKTISSTGAMPHAIGGPGEHGALDFELQDRCKAGETCEGRQLLSEAFRWRGLNLASVDAQLGRYFGTDTGVLVLSSGPMLEQLQPGDVIQRVDGKPVATPRAVMDALRDKAAGSTVPVEYLRDRATGTVHLKVPAPAAFPLLIDKVGALGPGDGRRIESRVMMIDADGKSEIIEHRSHTPD